ncbi:Ig-like domain-containing protein, partial [bacterium]|nr:Ig-like domain-containing protein [bacterium]
ILAYDKDGNPVPGADVSLFLDSGTHAEVIEILPVKTNDQGKATVQIRDAISETVIVSVVVDGVTLDDKPSV